MITLGDGGGDVEKRAGAAGCQWCDYCERIFRFCVYIKISLSHFPFEFRIFTSSDGLCDWVGFSIIHHVFIATCELTLHIFVPHTHIKTRSFVKTACWYKVIEISIDDAITLFTTYSQSDKDSSQSASMMCSFRYICAGPFKHLSRQWSATTKQYIAVQCIYVSKQVEYYHHTQHCHRTFEWRECGKSAVYRFHVSTSNSECEKSDRVCLRCQRYG